MDFFRRCLTPLLIDFLVLSVFMINQSYMEHLLLIEIVSNEAWPIGLGYFHNAVIYFCVFSLLQTQGVVNFFGRIAILIDQNTQAFHLFMTALLQVCSPLLFFAPLHIL